MLERFYRTQRLFRVGIQSLRPKAMEAVTSGPVVDRIAVWRPPWVTVHGVLGVVDPLLVRRHPPVFDPRYYGALAGNPRTLLDGDHDVFGDGTVRIISAPGHTPGHQVLLVDLVETGPVLLSGDLWHFRFNRAERRVPVFNTDPGQTLASMERIEQVLARTGAVLWLEHDLAQAETLLDRVHD